MTGPVGRVDLAALQGAARDGDDDPAKAAGALEAYFLRQMLAEVRNAGGAGGGLVDGGFAGSTFREMLDGALADAMAAAGGVGLAKTIEPALSPDGMEPAVGARPGQGVRVGGGLGVGARVGGGLGVGARVGGGAATGGVNGGGEGVTVGDENGPPAAAEAGKPRRTGAARNL